MFHTSYGQRQMFGYTDNDWTSRTFMGVAGLGVLAGSAALSYYANAEDDYRFGPEWMKTESGETPIWGDMRVILAVLSVPLAGWAAGAGMLKLAGLTGVLGASAVISFATSEGQRWRESGKLLGIDAPALPALPGFDGGIAAAPAIAVAPLAGDVAELSVVETAV